MARGWRARSGIRLTSLFTHRVRSLIRAKCPPGAAVFLGLLFSFAPLDILAKESEPEALDPLPIAAESQFGQESESFPQESYLDVEEMVIQGQATSTVAEDEATSAVTFNEEYLLQVGVQDIRDLSTFTPNLEVKTAFAAVNPTLFIRGVGLDDFNANSASAVSVYSDGTYMYSPAGQLFGLYDIQSIEVLRGPQPILTNASAGAILATSRKPVDYTEGYLSASLGGPDRDGVFAGYDERLFRGALNVPIVPGWVNFRGSFKARTRSGTTVNVCADKVRRAASVTDPGERNEILGPACVQPAGESRAGPLTAPSALTDYMNNIDNWAARGLISFKVPSPIGEEMDWLLNFNGGMNRSLATQYQHTGVSLSIAGDVTEGFRPGPQFTVSDRGLYYPDRANYTEEFTEGDPFAGEYDRVGPELLDLASASLTGKWSPAPDWNLVSVTGYVWHDRKTYANDDGGPRIWLDNDYTDHSNQLIQEIRATWDFGDENQILFGGTYLWEDLEGLNIFRNRRVNVSTPTASGYFAFNQTFEQKTSQWGAFAKTNFALPVYRDLKFMSDVKVDASLRYNSATKSFSQASLGVRGASSFDANVGSLKDTWDGLAGDVSLTYGFGEENDVYVKYSRGWKPGHYNLGTLTSGEPLTPVLPETVDSIEGGVRAVWFDSRLETRFTGFWYDYRDLQVFQTTVDARGNILRRLVNADSARVRGLEFEFTLDPLDGLTISATGAFLDSEYEKFGTTFQRNRRVDGSIQQIEIDQDYSGNRLIASPEWSFNGYVTYLIGLGGYGQIRPWYSAAYKGEFFFGPNAGFGAEGTLVERLLREPGYWLQSAGIVYTTPEMNWEIGLWIRNLTNEQYRIQSFDLSSPNRLILDIYGDPRTAGVTLTARFE